MSAGRRPLPVIHPDNREFWESLRRHELRLQRCSECGELRYPVSPVCHVCLSERCSWEEVSGRGRLVSVVRVNRATGDPRFGDLVPFSVALVRLDEGPRMKASISNQAADAIRPGDPLVACFDEVESVGLLRFEPVGCD